MGAYNLFYKEGAEIPLCQAHFLSFMAPKILWGGPKQIIALKFYGTPLCMCERSDEGP